MSDNSQSRLEDAEEYVLGKIYALEGQAIRQLFEQYRIAFERMKVRLEQSFPDDRDEWDATDPNFQSRTDALVNQLAAEMEALSQQSHDLSLDFLEDAYRAGMIGKAWVMAMAGLADPNIPLLPSEIIRAQLLTPYEGNTFLNRFIGHRLEFEQRIRQSLIQSQIEGEGIRKAQKRLAEELGVDIDRRKSVANQAARKNFNRTQTIVRSEIIRASALGAVATYRENSDVLRGWEWLTAQDERVCPICAPLDGRIFSLQGRAIDKKGVASHSLPPAHPMCRCAVAPALIDVELERQALGKRKTFLEWAGERGLTHNVYGQAFDLRGTKAPKLLRRAA